MNEKTKAGAELARFSSSFATQLLTPAAVGICTGACVAGLVGGVEHGALQQLGRLPVLLPALFAPLALLLTWLISRYVTRVERPSTSELYILTYNQPGGRIPLGQLPGRILATMSTVGLGGSQGFESTSALIGAAWSDLLARCSILAVSEDTRRSLLAAGASAGIAAVFSSPSVGALYGIEVPFKRAVDVPRLVPCAVAAVCSYQTRAWLIGADRLVRVADMPRLDGEFLLGCLLVALACGLGARLFARAEQALRVLGRKQSYGLRALTGGVLLSLLAVSGFLLCDAWITFGSGYVAADWLLSEPHPLGIIGLALLIRAAGNLVCVYGGGGGGVFTSLACNGAFLGEAVARLLRCDETHTLALLGAACFLGAGYRLPLACMLFVAEASLGPTVTGLGLMAIAIAQLFMGNDSVSDAQVDYQLDERERSG